MRKLWYEISTCLLSATRVAHARWSPDKDDSVKICINFF